MNFFQNLFALQVQGDWNITIAQSVDNIYIVSVLLKNEQCGDDAKKLIPPLVLKGTAQELDEGFFSAIEAPVKATAQLFTNMETYLKQQEEAKMQSQIEKDKQSREQKQKDERKKRYEEAMKKVAELEIEGKHKEAYCKMPDAIEFKEYADEIRKRKEELSAKFGQASLFNA